MSSQVVISSGSNLDILEVSSYIRGYHAYKEVWTPVVGESLLLRREPTNTRDANAVALYIEGTIVGHVPYNLAGSISHFLRREVNKAFAEVIGAAVNRGAGYGLEVPCIYRLYGPKAYIQKMKHLIDLLTSAGHL